MDSPIVRSKRRGTRPPAEQNQSCPPFARLLLFLSPSHSPKLFPHTLSGPLYLLSFPLQSTASTIPPQQLLSVFSYVFRLICFVFLSQQSFDMWVRKRNMCMLRYLFASFVLRPLRRVSEGIRRRGRTEIHTSVPLIPSAVVRSMSRVLSCF